MQINPAWENMKAFDYALSLSTQGLPAVWAAWGIIIEKRGYLSACVRDMVALGKKRRAKWFCAGQPSKAGHPHHPLYLRKDSTLEAFDIDSYMEMLRK